MKTFKWQLRKGGGKEKCPNCGHRTFVPYVLTANPAIKAGEAYGRCDRENNCAYIRYPRRDEVTIPTNIKPLPQRKEEPLRMSLDAVARTMGRSSLYSYVCNLVGAKKAEEAWRIYKVGAWGALTLFWQIDTNGEVRSGKGIPYLSNGHRDKSDHIAHAMWTHKMVVFRNDCKGERLEQCFFGEHLLRDCDKPVAIAESEKTALVMSVVAPAYTWLASGGSQGLSDAKCKVLQGRKVRLFPDNLMYFKWLGIANKYGWQCSDYCERHNDGQERGYDILDVYESLVK